MFLWSILTLTLTLFATNTYAADYDSTDNDSTSYSSKSDEYRSSDRSSSSYEYKTHSPKATLTEIIVDTDSSNDSSNSDNLRTNSRDYIYYYPSKNDHFYFLNRLPEELLKKTLTIALLKKPHQANKLSCVCKQWDGYVNNETTTQTIVEYMQKHNMDIFALNTAGRKKHFPSSNEITILRKERIDKQCSITIVVVGAPTLLAAVIGFSAYVISYDSRFLIPIPVTFVWPLLYSFCGPRLIEKIYPLLDYNK